MRTVVRSLLEVIFFALSLTTLYQSGTLIRDYGLQTDTNLMGYILRVAYTYFVLKFSILIAIPCQIIGLSNPFNRMFPVLQIETILFEPAISQLDNFVCCNIAWCIFFVILLVFKIIDHKEEKNKTHVL